MRRPAPDRDHGAAAVEFALVVPIFLVLVFGIIQYGYFFLQSTAAEHAAREGAREAAVGRVTCAQLETLVMARGGTANVKSVKTTFTDVSVPTDGYSRGDTLNIEITWRPLRFGLPVPFIDPGDITEQAATRVEFEDNISGACT